MDCFHCLGKKGFPLTCKGLMHMDLITGECLVCAGTGVMPPTVEPPTTINIPVPGSGLVSDVMKEVDEICSYVDELEKDKARLDFIEENGLGGHGWEAKVSHGRGFVINSTKDVSGTRTVREAIDEEMKRRNRPNK